LVVAGPLNAIWRKTGWSGTAASISASVGSRRSANWLEWKPPIVVTNSPAGTRAARAFSVASAAAIDEAFSKGV
jgi:hypothetical protein